MKIDQLKNFVGKPWPAVFHLASPSWGSEIDRMIHAAGGFQVMAFRGVFPQKWSYHPGRQEIFQAGPGRGGEVDRQTHAAGSFQVMAIRGVFPRKRSYQSGRQSVFHQVSPSRGSEVDWLAGAAGSFWAYASPWQ